MTRLPERSAANETTPMEPDNTHSAYRVIAEGDDALGASLTLIEAVALLVIARGHGKRYVAIVDDATGAIVDEDDARDWVERGKGRYQRACTPSGRRFPPEPPTQPDRSLAPCPACQDEGGEPLGDVLVQLPSGTWVREPC